MISSLDAADIENQAKARISQWYMYDVYLTMHVFRVLFCGNCRVYRICTCCYESSVIITMPPCCLLCVLSWKHQPFQQRNVFHQLRCHPSSLSCRGFTRHQPWIGLFSKVKINGTASVASRTLSIIANTMVMLLLYGVFSYVQSRHNSSNKYFVHNKYKLY